MLLAREASFPLCIRCNSLIAQGKSGRLGQPVYPGLVGAALNFWVHQMEKVERNQLIVNLRKQGATYRSIAQQVGVCLDRVRQILARNERLVKRQLRYGSMSTRAINCLKSGFMVEHHHWPRDEEITPQMVAENYTRKMLVEHPNLGKRTLQEIENWLAEHNLKLSE